MRVVFFGNTSFSLAILKYLHQMQVELVGVVTNPDKARHRSSKKLPSCVKQWSLEQLPGVPVLQPEKLREEGFQAELTALQADLFVVVAYGKILPESVLHMAKRDCINVHASLLPKYRGASPIEAALLAGDEVTGVSIMRMVKAMDAGPVFATEEVLITDDMTKENLVQQLEKAGYKALEGVIDAFSQGEVIPTPQEEGAATYVKKILPEDTKIEWQQSAKQIFNSVRAYGPKPGAWMEVKMGEDVKRVKVLACEAIEGDLGVPRSNLVFSKSEWIVAAGSGGVKLLQLQVQGKKMLDSKTFLAGCQKEIMVI